MPFENDEVRISDNRNGYKTGSHEHTVMVCGVLEIASENQKVDSKCKFLS